jgi:hypothetical protein
MSISERSNTPHIEVQLPSVYESVETPQSGTPRSEFGLSDADGSSGIDPASTLNGPLGVNVEVAQNAIDIPWVRCYDIYLT